MTSNGANSTFHKVNFRSGFGAEIVLCNRVEFAPYPFMTMYGILPPGTKVTKMPGIADPLDTYDRYKGVKNLKILVTNVTTIEEFDRAKLVTGEKL